MNMSIKFLLKNILAPFGRVTIKLGDTEISNRLLKYFNRRSWNRAFIKLKKYNISLIAIDQFSSIESYLSSINGKNSAAYFSRRCEKMGYTLKKINPNDELESIYKINTSSQERQGRKMGKSYLNRVDHWPNDEVNQWYGIYSSDGRLVAYMWLYLVGEMVLINRILGHKDHLKNNVMYLMTTKVIAGFINSNKIKYVMYDTFGRSENGLVLFKKRIGFKPYTVNFIK